MRSRLIFAIAALVVAGIAAGAWLLSRNPRPATGVAQTAQAGDMSVTVQVDDTTVGTRVFDVTVNDADGRPADIDGVKLRFSMTDRSINTDGSGLKRLTNFSEDLPMAAFSPDGTQIAILAENGVYLMEADGGRLRRIDALGDKGGLDWAR